MLFPVQFDGQLALRTVETRDIIANTVLPTELLACEFRSLEPESLGALPFDLNLPFEPEVPQRLAQL